MRRNLSIARWLHALFLMAVIAPFAAAETIVCPQKIAAYDVNQPSRQIGFFESRSSLDIEEYVAAARMYRVVYKLPDGKEVRALCQPEALGKSPPSESQPTTPAPPSPHAFPPPTEAASAPADPSADSSQPPLFTALLKFDPALWETAASKFALMQSRFGFRWVSLTDNNLSRCGRSPDGQPLTFLNQPIYETTAKFEAGKLHEVTLLIFGRGDAQRNLDENEFQQLMRTLEVQIAGWTSAKGLDAWVPGNATDTKRKSWFKFPERIDLEWSISRNVKGRGSPFEDGDRRFRAEFVRLAITPYDGKQDAAQLVKPDYQRAQPTAVKRAVLRERVKHESNGDLYLDGIPMVDQGQKGYCVNATVERVMRYYGLDIDQNEMAKAANTNTEGGTSPEGMFKAVKKLGGQFSLAVREIKSFDIRDFFRETEAYNKLAKREKRELLAVPQSGWIPVGDIYNHMDPNLLREIRLKKGNEKTKFVADITDLLERGAPALWTVHLGMVRETPALPQAQGGHMRLIIGFNKKTSEVIYTDSWGAGHEFKRMPLDDAFFITDGLYSIMPGS